MDQDTSTLRADIERERRELGETVAALAEKADVKSQAHRKIAETRENIDRKKSEVLSNNRRPIMIGAAVALAAVGLLLLRRRR
jgi:Protein of unknown function (DUF3618)